MEKEVKTIDQREKPIEIEIAEYLKNRGIFTLEQVKELLEPNFFAVIPINILEKKEISANAKLLYAEIMALSRKNGKCFATNKYLSERLGISERTISRLLKKLRNDALIYLDIRRDKEGTFRNITITYVGDRQVVREGVDKLSGRGFAQMAIQKRNRQSRNIQIDNIGSSSPNRRDTSFKKDDYNAVLEAYQRFRGITLQGKEFDPVMQDIKTMFMSKRTKEEIIFFMEWLAEKAASDDKKWVWCKNWTIKTVRIKLPEFLAGNFND